ncbi:head completion adaptor [Vibrio phage vB_VhaS_R21Y]|nr:head completion adaptor [Vibrio phage vB_VcaS_HC]WKV32821.1 head completion adaptor [Vibrio phage vB_VhaS_R21Y]
MLLATVAELRQRLNVVDNEIYNRVLNDLLLNSTLGIETHLNTTFAQQSYNNTYFAGENNYLVTGAPGRINDDSPGVLFLLLRGINVSNLSVGISTVLTGASSATNASNYELEERGIVRLLAGWLPNDYIKVTYTAGFTTDTPSGETLPIYQDVPILLKQACLMFAEHVYMVKYGDSQIDEDLPEGEDYTDPPNAVIQLLSRFSRTGEHALKAII